MIISLILTLGKGALLITWKEEYFRKIHNSEQDELIKISRKEYIAIRNEQRKIYSTQVLDKDFMESAYTIESIGYARKKRRLKIAGFFAVLCLTMLTLPGAIPLTLIYEAIFVTMICWWIPEYKDAKILQQAYDKAISAIMR